MGQLTLLGAGPSGSSGWSASSISDATLVLLTHDLSREWQDQAKTVPVTQVGQPIGIITELLGNDLTSITDFEPYLLTDAEQNAFFYFESDSDEATPSVLASTTSNDPWFDVAARTGGIMAKVKFDNATTTVRNTIFELNNSEDADSFIRLSRDANEKIELNINIQGVDMMNLVTTVGITDTGFHSIICKLAPGVNACYIQIDNNPPTTGTLGVTFMPDILWSIVFGCGIRGSFEDPMKGSIAHLILSRTVPSAGNIAAFKVYNPQLTIGTFEDFEIIADPVDRVISGAPGVESTVKDSIFTHYASATTNHEFQLIASSEFCTFTSQDPSIATVNAAGYVSWVSDGTVGIVCQTGSSIKIIYVYVYQSVVITDEFTRFVPGSLAKHIADSVDTRIAGKDPNVNKNIYTSQDHITPAYVRSAVSWPVDIDLTPISPWNDFQGINRAGTMVTKRHLIVAAHYFLGLGSTIRFVAADNTVVTRTIQSYLDVPGTDTRVHILDSDVPASIGICKIMPANYRDYLPGIGNGVPGLALDYEEHAIVTEMNAPHPTKMYMNCKVPIEAQRLAFFEPIIIGDSGNPFIVIINDEPVLVCCWLGGGAGSGPSYADQITQINQLIVDMTHTSAYPLTIADVSSFAAYYSRPISNVNSVWTTPAYTQINQPVFSTTGVPDSEYVTVLSAQKNTTQSYNMTDPKKACTQLVTNIRGGKFGTADPMQVSLTINGTTTAPQVIPFTSTASWKQVTFSGNWSAADFAAGYRINFIAGNIASGASNFLLLQNAYTENI